MYGRAARPSLRELIKDFQQIEPFANELKGVQHPEEIKIKFVSRKEPNIHSVISYLPEREQYFIGVKDNEKLVLRLFPESGSDFLYCMEADTFPNGIVGLKIDRSTNYIASTPRNRRTVRMNKLTGNPVVDDLTAYTMKQVIYLEPAKKLDYQKFLESYNSENLTAFIL